MNTALVFAVMWLVASFVVAPALGTWLRTRGAPGERSENTEHEEREEGVYRSERGYGHFRRQIPLPHGVKTDTATANFKNGVLEITIEAPQLAKNRRRIQIQGEEPHKAA